MTGKDSRVVGNKFLLLQRLYKRPEYNYSQIKLDKSLLKENFLEMFITHLDHNSKMLAILFVFPSNYLKNGMK